MSATKLRSLSQAAREDIEKTKYSRFLLKLEECAKDGDFNCECSVDSVSPEIARRLMNDGFKIESLDMPGYKCWKIYW